MHPLTCNCKNGHTDNGLNVFCYRTDFSDDVKWNRLLALTDTGEFPCTPSLCLFQDHEFENKSAEELKDRSTQTYVIADKQSMKDDTFLLAHDNYTWDDDTYECTGQQLKTMRYPANDLWAPVGNLPIANCDFDDFLPRRPIIRPTISVAVKVPREQLKARTGKKATALPRKDLATKAARKSAPTLSRKLRSRAHL